LQSPLLITQIQQIRGKRGGGGGGEFEWPRPSTLPFLFPSTTDMYYDKNKKKKNPLEERKEEGGKKKKQE